MELHKTLGCGFLEPVYQEALAIEFDLQKIPYNREEKLNIKYKGHQISKCYYADFICYEKIILELKALSSLTSEQEAQILNYLKVTDFKLGVINQLR